jgi:hypothetical protein
MKTPPIRETGQIMLAFSREEADPCATQSATESGACRFHFTTVPISERASVEFQLERLKTLGWTLCGAVDFIEKHGKAASSLPLQTIAEEYISTK